MSEWGKAKHGKEDHKDVQDNIREDTNTPRRRAIRNGMSNILRYLACGIALTEWQQRLPQHPLTFASGPPVLPDRSLKP